MDCDDHTPCGTMKMAAVVQLALSQASWLSAFGAGHAIGRMPAMQLMNALHISRHKVQACHRH
jgi:hypothetical protein